MNKWIRFDTTDLLRCTKLTDYTNECEDNLKIGRDDVKHTTMRLNVQRNNAAVAWEMRCARWWSQWRSHSHNGSPYRGEWDGLISSSASLYWCRCCVQCVSIRVSIHTNNIHPRRLECDRSVLVCVCGVDHIDIWWIHFRFFWPNKKWRRHILLAYEYFGYWLVPSYWID